MILPIYCLESPAQLHCIVTYAYQHVSVIKMIRVKHHVKRKSQYLVHIEYLHTHQYQLVTKT